jgi:hypothetical protein
LLRTSFARAALCWTPKVKRSFRRGGEENPAEAFAKGGNSDEQFQEYFPNIIW